MFSVAMAHKIDTCLCICEKVFPSIAQESQIFRIFRKENKLMLTMKLIHKKLTMFFNETKSNIQRTKLDRHRPKQYTIT